MRQYHKEPFEVFPGFLEPEIVKNDDDHNDNIDNDYDNNHDNF